MDGIKITKRDTNVVLRALTSAIADGRSIKPIQQQWLVLYVAALFKSRSTKDKRQTYPQTEIISQLRALGVTEANIKDKTDNRRSRSYYSSTDDFVWYSYDVRFTHFSVSIRDYRGSDTSGSYTGRCASFFDDYHNVDFGFIKAEQAAATLLELDSLIPQWIEQEWPILLFEAQKAAKIRNINENTIESMIKAKLEGTGITYYIEKQKLRVKAYFNIGCGMQVEWFLSHKNFMQQIDSVIKAITVIKETAEATGSTFTAKALDKSIHWQ